MSDQTRHPIRGILAGVAGGLVASWVMNQFIAGPGKQLTKAVLAPGTPTTAAAQRPARRHHEGRR
jgi:hypothetical protein